MTVMRGGSLGRRLLAVLLAAAVACSAAALAGCSNTDEDVRDALTQGIEEDIAQLTELSSETAASLFASDYTTDLQNAGVDLVSVYGPLFSDLTYTVDDVQVDGDSATVTLTVTNKDLTTALQNYTATISNELATSVGREALAALDDSELTQHLAEVLTACLEDASLGTTTTTVELSYSRSGNTWTLEDGTALTTALLGGLDIDAASTPTDAQVDATAETAEANVAAVGTDAATTDADVAEEGTVEEGTVEEDMSAEGEAAEADVAV